MKKHELEVTGHLVALYSTRAQISKREASAFIEADLTLAKVEHLLSEGGLEEKIDFLLNEKKRSLEAILDPTGKPKPMTPEDVDLYEFVISEEDSLKP